MLKKGFTIFLTGLSGAGKSTIANLLAKEISEKYQRLVTLLDGDIMRQHLSKGLGFSREDRNRNIERIGFVANEIVRHGGIAICSAIAPYRESRDKNRKLIEQNGSYVEVYISTPLEVCTKRDVKGLYAQAKKGELKNFTGIDDPYEEPENPDIKINTAEKSKEESVEEILNYLSKR